MSYRKEYNTFIAPVITGLPIIIALAVLAIALASRSIQYTTPQYQAVGSIKIDTRQVNLGELAIFDEKNGKATSPMIDFMTEVETFRSRSLLEETFKNLDFDVSYFRIGSIKTKELYHDNPFILKYKFNGEELYDKDIFLKYKNDGRFIIGFNNGKEGEVKGVIQFGRPYHGEGYSFTIEKNEKYLSEYPNALSKDDLFSIKINSIAGLCRSVDDSNYFVRPIDKDINIIKLYYQHEIPEKAELFVNTLMKTYIESCKNKQNEDATNALAFIDEQLSDVKAKLKDAEGKMVRYKTQAGIVNIQMELDANLKERMQLDLQEITSGIQRKELDRIFTFLTTGKNLEEFAPNFESLKDPVFRDAYIKAQNFELERHELLMKFTPLSDEVVALDSKINELRTFIHESVKNTLAAMSLKESELESAVSGVSKSLKSLPDKQQKAAMFEREVMLNQELYTYMSEKRMEMEIAGTANTVFHSIIDPAVVSNKPVKPNKALMYGVAVFFALLMGLLLAFLRHYYWSTINKKENLSLHFTYPLVGTVGKLKKKNIPNVNAVASLYTNLEILRNNNKETIEQGMSVLISSMMPNEGKTFTATHLARAYAAMGRKVLLVDMDIQNPGIHKKFYVGNEAGLSELLKGEITKREAIIRTATNNLYVMPSGQIKNVFSAVLFSKETANLIESLKQEFDCIILDTPAMKFLEDGAMLMHHVDFNLFLIRTNHSKLKNITASQERLESYKIPNLHAVLNGVKMKKQSSIFKIDILETIENTVGMNK